MSSMVETSALLALCWSIFVALPVQSQDWGYANTEATYGTDEWALYHPDCKGQNEDQSPILLDRDRCVPTDKNIVLGCAFSQPRDFLLKNEGGRTLSAAVTNTSGWTVTVQTGDQEETYVVAVFHFHWGSLLDLSPPVLGSEHRITGSNSSLEMHIVSFKSSYGTLDAAKAQADGLLVMGTLFEVGATNTHFDPLLRASNDVTKADSSTTLRQFRLRELMPQSLNYINYKGSLTTPPCLPIVDWFVFRQINGIAASQMGQLQQLRDEAGEKIMANYRPVQPLGKRQIFCN